MPTPDNLARRSSSSNATPPLPLSPDAILAPAAPASTPTRPASAAPAIIPAAPSTSTPAVTPAPPPAATPKPARRPDIAQHPAIWKDFNAQLTLATARRLVGFGPRTAGSAALDQARDEIVSRLGEAGWQVKVEVFSDQGPDGNPVDFRSLRARFLKVPKAQAGAKRFLMASHFDTERSNVVQTPGATDGGAGPAILLEIARVLSGYPEVAAQVELLFLDGNHPFRQVMANDGLFGSRFAVQMLQVQQRSGEIRAMIDLENLGGRNSRLYYAPNSDPDLVSAFQRAAGTLAIPLAVAGRPLLGDHVPFQQANIPAIALLDAESPYLHTADDTADRLDPESLAQTGQLVLNFLSGEIFSPGI
ncbi:MAG: M28 family peptidase [Verrucomicrobia bacterium]|nr:M28 family peptidase [Verrucomicrobiota bacterium]